MLHSVKTLMLVGLLMLLPAAADAAVVHKTPEPGASGWVAECLAHGESISGRGTTIDPNGVLGKFRATSAGQLTGASR